MLIIVATSCCTLSNDEDEDDDLSIDLSSELSTTPGYNIQSIYAECNDSFITKIDFLIALNETGSFPEESDKTPLVRIQITNL